jgi:hypothetical protein
LELQPQLDKSNNELANIGSLSQNSQGGCFEKLPSMSKARNALGALAAALSRTIVDHFFHGEKVCKWVSKASAPNNRQKSSSDETVHNSTSPTRQNATGK